jgi:light-regulated signal transduction histidine kinase (bacteriophytochrome)
VILTTGYGDPEVDMQAMAAGATDYLTKAEWTPAALERCIRYALEHVRSRQALVEAYEEMEREVAERTAELTAANEALKGSVEDMKRFAYSVCHDLKGPAIGIHGLTKRLYQRYGDQMDQKGQAHCRQIIRATEEIAALVENINTYIGAKEATLRLQPVRLQDVFAILWEDFADILSARDIAWKQPESLPTIYADYLGMLRIFRNLVENALKYGGEELTAIRIEYNDTDDHHIIAVRDDGPGIRGCPNRILSPFQRNSPSKDIPGNGLGLAIVKELATQHKGDVWFAPQNRVGCTIHVSISKHLQP